MKKSFYARVYEVVAQIPRGKVASYKQIAILAGNPRAARAVGTAMKNNPDMKTVPCHRVVGKDGAMHGYSAHGGIGSKIRILKKEGVKFIKNKADLRFSRWNKH